MRVGLTSIKSLLTVIIQKDSLREHIVKVKEKVSEETKYDKYDKEKKQFGADQRMKFGKFYSKQEL